MRIRLQIFYAQFCLAVAIAELAPDATVCGVAQVAEEYIVYVDRYERIVCALFSARV